MGENFLEAVHEADPTQIQKEPKTGKFYVRVGEGGSDR